VTDTQEFSVGHLDSLKAERWNITCC